ncbi:MAG: CBM21 domain-containing protein [Treponema sp.]|nr:CBM21 domain-containing protein [Treponema sp.]
MEEIKLVSAEKLLYTHENGRLIIAAQLKVVARVRNRNYEKLVGLRYSVDQFKHYVDTIGQWSRQVNSEIDEFVILSRSDIPPGTLVQYTLFYQVGNITYWDPPDGTFYSIQL